MIKIEVKVIGGLLPIPIRVSINNLNNENDISLVKKESFEYSFNPDENCPYTITISGQEPFEGKVKVHLYGDFQEGPIPSENYESGSELFSAFFMFTA